MISVLVPSNRVGGLDILFGSLESQTERDFEVILVDNIRKFRGIETGSLWPHSRHILPMAPIWWHHIEPSENRFPAVQYCATMNEGIAHASGETLLYICDYSWLHPRCLELHAELQKKHRGPVTLDYRYVGLPPLKRPIDYREKTPGTEETAAAYTAEVNANADRYLADLQSGALDDLMWSIFAEPVTPEVVASLPVEHEHKPSGADLANDWNWCSFKNESFPTELLLEMNGHNEAYDESHAWQDSELSYRFRERGIRWHSGPPGEGLVTVLNPRNIMNIKKLAKPLFYNRELCFGSRRAELKLPVNPGFSLREWRKKETGIG